MEALLTTEGIISLLTLTFLEIVLGIDNIVFISITAGRLPQADQKKARNLGILLALLEKVKTVGRVDTDPDSKMAKPSLGK